MENPVWYSPASTSTPRLPQRENKGSEEVPVLILEITFFKKGEVGRTPTQLFLQTFCSFANWEYDQKPEKRKRDWSRSGMQHLRARKQILGKMRMMFNKSGTTSISFVQSSLCSDQNWGILRDLSH